MTPPVQSETLDCRLREDDPVRLGAMLLSTDMTFERDAARLIDPAQAALHVARIAFENPTTPDRLRAMTPDMARTAALLVPGIQLSAIAFCCTSASVAIGNPAVREAIGEGLPGVPVITPASAAIAGFAALGVTRVAMLTPYLPETAAPLATYFNDQGLEVMRNGAFALEDDRDMARIDDESIINGAASLDGAEVEAFFLSCTSLRGVDVIDRIEARLGKPVVTSNQALCWALQRMGGLSGRPDGYGRLFDCDMPSAHAQGIIP
ncbi:ectoine utilization protein EutA [Sulfitobacter sp. 1A12157]|uniref:aspartate racemase/maleate isomerase family protein n=1 Tax=Sulfitobacter sp. 1A12157 TaxID=3368594 RepID=UPI0037457AF8